MIKTCFEYFPVHAEVKGTCTVAHVVVFMKRHWGMPWKAKDSGSTSSGRCF
jgi:hypothetical protein